MEIRSVIKWSALLGAGMIFLLLPTAYFYSSYHHLQGKLDGEVHAHVTTLNAFIASHPETWEFEEFHLVAILEAYHRPGRRVEIHDNQSRLVASHSDDISQPTLSKRADLTDYGLPVGQVVITASLSALLLHTSWVVLGCLALALLIFYPLHVLPLRALDGALNSLRQEKERAQVTLHSIGDAVITTDKNSLIENLNPIASELTGWNQSDAIGKPVMEVFNIIREDDRLPVENPVKTCLDKESIIGLASNTLLINRSGVETPIDDSVAPIRTSDGAFIGAILVFRDVSERRQAESALHQAREEAIAANEAKSVFLATMSHEIRTPLNAIIGMGDLLGEGTLHPEQAHYVTIINRSGRALLSLINDILDLSKIEAGQLELYVSAFNLREMIENTLSILEGRAKEKGLLLTQRISHEVPRSVVGDQQRLRQVLINLLGNAIKFTGQGVVKLLVERENSQGGDILFSVMDTGPGIPEERLDSIFEPFTQVDASVTRRFGGTGLGLAISQQLVSKMGGRIWVESEVGKGSVFRFSVDLPWSEKQQEPDKQSERRAQIRSGEESLDSQEPKSILLVDDAEDNLFLIQAYLKKTGHHLQMAENGLEALEKFKAAKPPFDLVLMDIQMPVMDGYESTLKMRAWEAESGMQPTPIIALSAHAMKEVTDRVKVAGCDIHLVKPIQKKRLLGVIDHFTK
ncbi:MAG: response regulator [Magnetococcales bacterium]|nr:response regulator [Magnetococcales bacterium]